MPVVGAMWPGTPKLSPYTDLLIIIIIIIIIIIVIIIIIIIIVMAFKKQTIRMYARGTASIM